MEDKKETVNCPFLVRVNLYSSLTLVSKPKDPSLWNEKGTEGGEAEENNRVEKRVGRAFERYLESAGPIRMNSWIWRRSA